MKEINRMKNNIPAIPNIRLIPFSLSLAAALAALCLCDSAVRLW
jgi:hypothetical protein